MKKYGRKPKLTPSVVNDLVSAFGIGATVNIACAYSGVSPAAYYLWLKKGREALEKFEKNPDAALNKDEEKYLKFYDDIEKSKAFAAIGWLQVVNEAASVEPGYALKMLKIRYPDGFSEVQKSEVDMRASGSDVLIDTFNKHLSKTYPEEENE